tara:strand:+ start:839 stop:1882 length:1044 start_codon:yes stop_codon:yes gene_type:complete
MKRINLQGQNIRLFFDRDLDGVVAASLIIHYSGANIVKLVPAHAHYRKPAKEEGVLDVFVDCRSANRDEDIRIDHHASGEEKEYLNREGILVDASFDSAVSLVAKFLGIKVNRRILQEMDKADSGKQNAFSKFKFGDNTIHHLMLKPGLSKDDFTNFEIFKDKVLGFMEKGFAVEDLRSLSKYEQMLEVKYRVVIDEIKKLEQSPLVKFVHSPVKEGLFKENIFKLSGGDFFGKVLPYVNQHYEVEASKDKLGVYVAVGFRRVNEEFDDQLKKIYVDNHPEPYQIFVKRSASNTTIDISQLIQKAKTHSGIVNGGGRADVGGLNSSNKRKAIKALRLIIREIKRLVP